MIGLQHRSSPAVVTAMFLVLFSGLVARSASAQSDPTYYSTKVGVFLDRQCVPVARDLARVFLGSGKVLPHLGAEGVAAQMWNVQTPGFRKVANDGKSVPAWFCILVFGPKVGGGSGHLAVCVAVKDRATRTVWVLDGNFFKYPNGLPRGALHTMRLDARLLGWLE